MTKRTYVCNVCRDEFAGDRADREIVGFEFGHRFVNTVGEDFWRHKDKSACGNHICRQCLASAAEFAAIVPPRPDSPNPEARNG